MSAPARYRVRYASGDPCCLCRRCTRLAAGSLGPSALTEDHDFARAVAKLRGGKVYRLVSHEESKRKAAAEALRAMAKWCREQRRPLPATINGIDEVADEADRRADALWPRKGAGRG